MIEVTNLTKRFGPLTVLRDVNLKVPAGSICGFIGPNGAGKTTTMRILATLELPTSGSVRIAGDFKGDVNVQGNLTIEQGAHLTGGVKADTVIIGGQLDGNIDAASRVELLQTGVLNGELKAGSLTVAAGSRMRGKAEFGWDEKPKH